MENNLIYTLFICIVVPLLLFLLLLKRRSQLLLGFLLIGISLSPCISELNTMLLELFDDDMIYVTTCITPVTEEIIKAVPVLFYAVAFNSNRDKLLTVAFAVGIGFALFENTMILVQNVDNVTVGWAIIRGFSTALMHGVSTATVGFGMSFIKKKRKLFYCGTFALLMVACIHHGIFNMLVQMERFKYFGFFLPLFIYLPVAFQMIFYPRIKAARESKKSTN